MPWTAKQVQVAQAVEHGWKPKGSAKGFTHSFAAQVVEETRSKKYRGKRMPDLMGKP